MQIHIFPPFVKEENLFVFLFASKDDEAFPKWGLILKGRICSLKQFKKRIAIRKMTELLSLKVYLLPKLRSSR